MQKTMIKENHLGIYKEKSGGRYLFIIPLLMLSYAIFNNTSYPTVAWLATAAAFASVLAIVAANYKFMSFVTVYSLMNLITYPIAAFANLLLESPAVRSDLWAETDMSMVGGIIGMLSFFLGAFLYKTTHMGKYVLETDISTIRITKKKFNISLVCLIFLIAALKYNTGLYYHGSIIETDMSFSGFNNTLEHLTWVAYCGIFLQVYRYTITRKNIDGILSIVLILVPILIYLPSGAREQTLGFLPLLIIAYISWEKRNKFKFFIVGACGISIIVILVAIGIYRDIQGVSEVGMAEKYELLMSVEKGESVTPESILVGRLSDFVATGRIISETPTVYPYRYLEGVEDWWQIAVPGFLRPAGREIHMQDGAETAFKYGVNISETYSTPVMTIGDLYSRFGWSGIIIGMFCMGLILNKLDNSFLQNDTLHKYIFFILFCRVVWRLYASSLLINFVAFTRDLLLIYIVALVLYKISLRYAVLYHRLSDKRVNN